VEPNNGIATANPIPLGFDVNEESEIDINAFLSTAGDTDVFRLQLNGGDILGVNVFGAALSLSLLDGNGIELQSTSSDASFFKLIDDGQNPLPGGGNASLGRVISDAGTYYLQVSNADPAILGGAYTAQLRVFRPELESAPVGTHQILFVDFNGAVLDTAIFGGVGQASLSPLSAFLPSWGFSSVDENALIDAILGKLEEDLYDEIRLNGKNGDFLRNRVPGQFDLEIRNSRDHADPFGLPNVSRLIVGGTIGELGIGVLGIAESIDVGNFDTEETAVILLDIMSGQINAGGLDDLNAIPLAADASKIDLVAAGVGGVAAHEAGHFFGLWHTNNANNVQNLIDVGGNGVLDEVGVGPDGIFGSPDDVNTSFLNPDQYNPAEFFTGTEDTLNTLSWSLASGTQFSTIAGLKFHDLNGNGIKDANDPGLSGWTIFSDINGNGLQDLREPAALTAADGTYFMFVAPGQHTVREVLQPGWIQTAPIGGSHTVRITALNQTVGGINFGNKSLFGGISGTKFNDLDGDGIFDQGEPGVPGVFIYLDLDGDNRMDLGEPAAQTDTNGNYAIPVPNAGTFTVREHIVPGWELTFPRNAEREHTIVVQANQSVSGINFGNHASSDFGDAPTLAQSGFAKSYPTLRADGGAVHAILPGFHLGASVDGDPDGNPTGSATGDDGTTTGDEDGVTFLTNLSPGSPATVQITVATGGYSPGRLNAWIDFNQDGDWADEGEQIIRDTRHAEGAHDISFTVPASARAGLTYARFRYGYARNIGPGGADMAGEVEDYQIRILGDRPTAVDDQFTVNQDSVANSLAVLDNDIPSLFAPLTIIAVSSTASGGSVLIAPNGLAISYTPPLGFFGNDSFSYTVRDGAGNTDSAQVSVTILPSLVIPVAVDDTFTVNPGSTNNALNVLANDLTGQQPPIGIVNVQQPAGGTATLDNRGTPNPSDDLIRYTPGATFSGTDQFTYTIQDLVGNRSTATITVHVDDQDDDRVRIKVQAVNAVTGQPIQAIGVGEQFRLQVSVADDLRTDDEDGDDTVDRFGVAAAYLDVLYNFNLVSLAGTAQFSADYQNAVSIGTTIPGLLDEAGAFQTNTQDPLGSDEIVLFTIPMRANAVGVADFKADPADRRTGGQVPPDHDVLLFHPPQPVLLEQIRYESSSLTIVGSGGLPVAVDNTFRVAANSTANILDVLANDVEVSNPPLRITGIAALPGAPALQGTVTISGDGSRLSYTPRAGFVGTEQFRYTATNAVQLSASAIVTVQVGNPVKDVNIRLAATDVAGNPITTINTGSEFQVRAFVQDVRTSPPDPTRMGVFAVYFDMLYNSQLVSTVADPANRFGFDIDFATPYAVNGLSANNSFLNVIDEVGAFQDGDQATGSGELLVFSITFRANVPGTAAFLSDPADTTPFHDVLLFEPPANVPDVRINYGQASITVVAAANAEGEFTNPKNAFDVNDDSFVSPIDVLLIKNDLNRNGARDLFAASAALGEGESAPAKSFIDVSGDGKVSPLDALLVINYLNKNGPLGEGEASALLETPVAQAASEANPSASLAAVVLPNSLPTVGSGRPAAERTEAAVQLDQRAVDTLVFHSQMRQLSARSAEVDAESHVSDELLNDLLGISSDEE